MPPEELIANLSSLEDRCFEVPGRESHALPYPPRAEHDRVTDEHGLHRLLRLHRDGASLATIAAALNAEGFRTPQGMRWHRATVARVIRDIAYPSLVGAGDEAPEA